MSSYAHIPEKYIDIHTHPWNYAAPAFRVFGNLYFVGNENGASWLLETEEGLVLFDTNWPSTAAMLVDSIWSLGFDPRKIVAIFHTHGHYDHIGASEYLRKLSGAKLYLGKADCDMFRQQPELSYVQSCKWHPVEIFTPDVEVNDGDVFTFGTSTVRCVSCPGHTAGTLSFFFPATDGETTYTAAIYGGSGVNTVCEEFREEFGIDARQDYVNSLEKVWNEKVDIALASHTRHNGCLEKLALVNESTNPFVDSTLWQKMLQKFRDRYDAMIAEENEK